MSIKINVFGIVKDHINTLRDDESKKFMLLDGFTFLSIPIALSAFCMYQDIKLSKEFLSASINFGAIFSALLMSVLMLVYDQESKINSESDCEEKQIKKDIFKQLYSNICFTIICAVLLVLLCMVKSNINESFPSFSRFILVPLIVFFLYSTTITTLVVLKRMHVLLETNR